MWRVPSERMQLDLGGPLVEVERLHSWNVQFEGLALLARFMAADKPEAEYSALSALYEHFMTEAQPQWDIVDHRGPVPLSARGMARLPLDTILAMVTLWLNSLPLAEKAEEEEQSEPSREPLPFDVVESGAPTAADAVLPPGPVNLEVKRRLRAARRTA